MASLNKRAEPTKRTHEGAPARTISAEAELRRSVLSCLLWEDTFYEDGVSIAERIDGLVGEVSAEVAASIAIEARRVHNLRHVPLLIAVALEKRKSAVVPYLLGLIIQRPDEITEFLTILWDGNSNRKGKLALRHGVKRGLAAAFQKFNAYQLAKYKQTDKALKLRDAMFLVHPKPKDALQGETFNALAEDKLPIPDTWETELSAGKDKHTVWTRLLNEGKLGGLALLRNLRNMEAAGVDRGLIASALERGDFRRVLPFRFIAAARAAPSLEPAVEAAMMRRLAEEGKLKGDTTVLVDVSGSMNTKLSEKSDLTRMDAAAALAAIVREIAETGCRVFTFSDQLVEVPARRGFALVEAIKGSQAHRSTMLGKALAQMPQSKRLIVVTDEQSHDSIGLVPAERAYCINVAAYQHGVGYGKRWTHLDGFSEGVLKYIVAVEQAGIGA